MRRAWLVRAGLAAALVAAAILAVPRVGLGPAPVEPAEPTLTPTQMSDTSALIERFGAVVTAALPTDVVAQPGGATTSNDPRTGALTMIDVPVNVERSGGHGQIIASWLVQAAPAVLGGAAVAVSSTPLPPPAGGKTGTVSIKASTLKTVMVGGQELWIDSFCAS